MRLVASKPPTWNPLTQSCNPVSPAPRVRWIAERSPLVEALGGDGSFLDVGCANGLLAEDVVGWAAARGLAIEPHGVDIGKDLVALVKRRHPEAADHFRIADAWTWEPTRRWTYVYSLLDLSPRDLWCHWLRRLSSWVEPGGRLIIGSYDSRGRSTPPIGVAAVYEECGLAVAGSSHGGEPLLTRFAWSAR